MNRNVFDRRFRAFKIPKDELDRMYLMELESSITAPSEEAFQMAMMNEFIMPSGAGGVLIETVPSIPSNCIQFVVDTTSGESFGVYIYNNAQCTYSVDWGDGTVIEDQEFEAFTLEHTYEVFGEGIQYTVRLCFSNPSSITELDFQGN